MMKKFLLFAALAAVCGFANAQNPYAYAVSADGITEGKLADKVTDVTFHYTLNAAAVAVSIDVYNGTQVAASFTLDSADCTVGEHAVTKSVANLAKDVTYTWKVNVTGAAVAAPTEIFSSQGTGYGDKKYQFWSPYGIAVDNNFNSEHFGRVLVTETQANIGDTYWTKTEGVGPGIYAFDPQLKPIKNSKGTNGFNGGLNIKYYKYLGGTGNKMFGLKKVRISDDGRIFVGSLDLYNAPLYEVDPDNLDSFSPVFKGAFPLDTVSGYVLAADSSFVGGLSACFDVMGSGDSLKIVNLSSKNGFEFAYGSYRCDEYKLGKAKTWSTAPSRSIEDYTSQYTISAQSVSIAYDPNGGIWYCQYRATPSAVQPAIKHVNAKGVEDYSDITTIARGGGIGYNVDKSLLATTTALRERTLYQVDYDADGKPNLTQVYKFAGFSGANDFAFDIADNLYTCDNGDEVFVQYAIPRVNNSVATPAMAKYDFLIPTPSGVENVNKSNATVVAGKGFIEVTGAKNVAVYNTAGALISTAAKCEVNAGIYVVRFDGRATKVLVR